MKDVKTFLLSLAEKTNPDVLEGLDTVFHFDIEGAGQYTVSVKNGKLDTREGLHGEAKCKVTSSADAFGKLLSGELSPMKAIAFGKIKISNLSEMMKVAGVFGLM